MEPRYTKGFPRNAADLRRFLSKVVFGECWEWAASVGPGHGYGQFGISAGYQRSNRAKRAHCVAYELFVEPVPPGASVLHHCDNKLCVRPGHLYLGDQRQNMKDAYARNPNVRRGLESRWKIRKH